jgi:hypothetical protein
VQKRRARFLIGRNACLEEVMGSKPKFQHGSLVDFRLEIKPQPTPSSWAQLAGFHQVAQQPSAPIDALFTLMLPGVHVRK